MSNLIQLRPYIAKLIKDCNHDSKTQINKDIKSIKAHNKNAALVKALDFPLDKIKKNYQASDALQALETIFHIK